MCMFPSIIENIKKPHLSDWYFHNCSNLLGIHTHYTITTRIQLENFFIARPKSEQHIFLYFWMTSKCNVQVIKDPFYEVCANCTVHDFFQNLSWSQMIKVGICSYGFFLGSFESQMARGKWWEKCPFWVLGP